MPTDEVMVDKREMKGKKLTGEESKCIVEVLSKHRQCISNEPGETGAAEHEVDTGLNKPIASVPYRLCAQWQEQVKQELESLLAVGIIRESTSPWASPIVPVRKPDGSIRLCVDFRKLNAITEPDPFYMPAVDEVIDKLGEAKYLFKLDLSKGFYQIKVAPKDVPKTAFITPYGKYEFLRMPFGLRNTPSTFQRTMQTVLRGQEPHSSPYIDDVVIFSNTWEEHLKHIDLVLQAVSKNGLTISVFGRRSR